MITYNGSMIPRHVDRTHLAWRDAVIYQIFIDRFAGYDPHRNPMEKDFIGGNLAGIRENLAYLQKLGVTCIYLTPFFKGAAYHGYHATDFFSIDPRFGTELDLHALVDDAHSHGMKVMIDFVPNHCSNHHPVFVEAQQYPGSQYRSWFRFVDYPRTYRSFMNLPVLPQFNFDNKDVWQYLIKAGAYWLETFDLDALRLDHVLGPPVAFWQEFRDAMINVKPEVFLLAEANLNGVDFRRHHALLSLPISVKELRSHGSLAAQHHALMLAYGDTFDGYLDFTFQGIIVDFVRGALSFEKAQQMILHHVQTLPSKNLVVTQLDNHDLDRIMWTGHNDVNRVAKAIELQFSIDQPKLIYYGTEIGLTQRAGFQHELGNTDILARQPMPPIADRNLNHPLFTAYQRCTGGIK